MDGTGDPRVALLGYGYWGPNLARNLHIRLGQGWVDGRPYSRGQILVLGERERLRHVAPPLRWRPSLMRQLLRRERAM